ncbi:phage late control D family protein [Meridianimarinicoccus sp. RP-17]|uniref:phage late control D family protein n=1 Tax=Meridianimarinicoccus zhengii TaxID=2056810 RepID=UPI000DAC6BF3|nr:phage late control D family protein [Phycocomes zhengii]
MTVETFIQGRNFLTPAFRIELNGQDAGREVISDILEVSFTSDLANIDSFEFVLHDWDPVGLRPKYSSPWDETGTPLRLSPGGPEVPNFEPGAQVTLYMGYLEDGDLPLIMEGEVVSLAPSFPASGSPVCRVRALDGFLRRMQKTLVEGNYSGTEKAIVDQLCLENDVPVRWATLDSEGEAREDAEIEGTLYDEVLKRAKAYGLSLMVEPGGTLYLAQPSQSNDPPVAEFIWGRTLISFTPALSAAGQVSEVVVRGGDPDQSGDAQNVEVSRTWSDIGLSPSALGPSGSADIDTAVSGVRQILKPDGIRTEADAERAALAKLRELAATLITGSGSAIGLPTLRAGATVTMAGMGARFDGTYRLTQATHAIGGSGYTTSFQARKEVLDG